MKNKYLIKLHNTQFDILERIDKICKENNLQYFLMYGTLLGAVRHSDFIPWDDDLDIAMPREDYEKFIEITSNYNDDKYFLDYFTTNKDYYLPFAKFKNKNTIYEEKNTINYTGNKGIWVDIFPLDNFNLKRINLFTRVKRKLISMMCGVMLRRSLQFKVSFHIEILSKFINNIQCQKIIKKMAIKKGKNEYFIGIDNPLIFKKGDIFPLKKIKFGKCKYNVPNNFSSVLRVIYGDNYMELPPIEKRITHNPNKIVFEDNEVVEFDD